MFGLFGDSIAKSIESVAKEFIETDMERAESRALMVKTLDPNGLMRRNLSNRVSVLYTIYILITMVLLVCQSFDIGNAIQIAKATTSLTNLFLPITGMFSSIVLASFGVNGMNSHKGN